jgi:hypothetical protein
MGKLRVVVVDYNIYIVFIKYHTYSTSLYGSHGLAGESLITLNSFEK